MGASFAVPPLQYQTVQKKPSREADSGVFPAFLLQAFFYDLDASVVAARVFLVPHFPPHRLYYPLH